MDLVKLPKIELHCHFDGSLNIDEVSNITGKCVDELEKDMIAPEKCKDLNEYLTKFDVAVDALQKRDNISKLAYLLGEDLKKDGVIYAEVRFAPLLHTKENLSLDNIVLAVLEGFSMVKDIKINLILCMMRHMSFEENKQVIDLCSKYLGQGVCGIDLAGAEALYKTSDFEELFKLASKADIPFTIHAGEADGVDSINSALNFGATRIGHGVRCLEDIGTMDRLKMSDVTLEVCPTSNVQTNMFESIKHHPIKYLYDNGILVTVNTDNRLVSNVSLTDEYKKLVEELEFSEDELIIMNFNAISASFLSESDKEDLRMKYFDCLNKLDYEDENFY